jgi:hypothetical protein
MNQEIEYYKCYKCPTIINSESYNRCYYCDSNNKKCDLLCDDCIEQHLKICVFVNGA